MGRTVTAVVTHDGTCAGAVGPFPVDVPPWWSEVEPVTAHLEQVLGVPVVVLRLLAVEGADGMRDGHVSYHAEALQSPGEAGAPRPAGELTPCEFAADDHPLRMHWARPEGVRELLDWAAGHVELTGRPVQRKTWNLSCLFRLPVADGGAVWLKAIPPFAAAEPAAIAAFAEVDPGLVPEVLASGPGRLLLGDIPGTERRDQSPRVVADTLRRFVAAQARVSPPRGLTDRRPESLAAAVRDLLDGPVGAELTAGELRAARSMQDRWEMLAGCGLPDTVVHGDFHPVNWRADGDGPVVLDWADAHLGNPVLDGLRAIDFLPPALRQTAAAAWIAAWTAAAPRSRPADALRIAEPLAQFAFAVRYQEFLDNIEPSERVYHHGDPAAAIRTALAGTSVLDGI